MRTLDEIADLFIDESSTLEWKPGRVNHKDEQKAVLRTLVAFANDLKGEGQPGVVVLGVDDEQLRALGAPLGLPGLSSKEADRLEQILQGWGREQCKPPLPLTFERIGLAHDPQRVLLLCQSTPDGELRYVEDKLPVRDGKSTVSATAQNGYLGLLQRRQVARATTFWDQPLPGLDLSALDPVLLLSELRDLPGRRSTSELLDPDTRLDAALGGRLSVPDPSQGMNLAPTRLAVLLCTAEPHRHLPGAWTELVEFPGTTRSGTARRRRLTGPLLRQIAATEASLDLINAELVGAFDSGSPGLQNHRLYSPSALHEALANAYAHRDWSSTAEIRVEVFSDRIEISSPGGPVSPMDPTRLREGRCTPLWRNGPLASVLTHAGVANRFGKGLSIVVEETRRTSRQDPTFLLEPERFTVVIPCWTPERIKVAPGQSGLILISVGGESIEGWVDQGRADLGLLDAPTLVRWHRHAYLGERDWSPVAQELKRLIQPLVDDRNIGSLHLFFKGPVALAALIGAMVPQVKPLVVYHFEENHYHPTLTLDRRFLKS